MATKKHLVRYNPMTGNLELYSPSTAESISNPPSGMCEVKNIYVDPDKKKVVVDYDDNPK